MATKVDVILRKLRESDAGLKGDTGIAGKPGGGVSIPYTFRSTTTDSDPGDGNLRLNNSSQYLTTKVFVNYHAADGSDWQDVLGILAAGASTVKGQLRLFAAADPSRFLLLDLIGETGAFPYYKLEVTAVQVFGNPLLSGELVYLEFTKTGDRGDQGDTGVTGNAGEKGDTGVAGSHGDTGVTGAAGSHGDTGATGAQGGKGDTGSQGTHGDTGTTGSTGGQGDTGIQGDTGTQGDTGITGLVGSQGDTGTHGDTGVTGLQGTHGDTGITGSQGTHGDTGVTGNTGAKGDTGLTGAQGTHGDTGTTGSQGVKGDTGTTGNTGAKGDTGTIGNTGAKGDTGAASTVKGDTGTTGNTGAKGDTGAASTVKGDTGTTGNTGAKGDTGVTGNQGDTGAASTVKGDTGVGITVVNSHVLNLAGEFGIAYAKYSFATDGGLVSTITPGATVNTTIPANAILVGGVVNVTTAVTSSGLATVGIGCAGTGGSTTLLLAATAKASLTINVVLPTVTTFAAPKKLTGAGGITFTIGTAALTAGVIEVWVEYFKAAA